MDAVERQGLNDAMRRLAGGERDAFRPLFDGLWPVMHRFARVAVASPSDADDIAQEAMMQLMGRASDFREGGDVVSWALALTAWQRRTLLRRRQRSRARAFEPDMAAHDAASPEDVALHREMTAAAALALGTLTPLDREALLAGLAEPRPPDVSGATLRKRRQRALGRLRAALGGRYG